MIIMRLYVGMRLVGRFICNTHYLPFDKDGYMDNDDLFIVFETIGE